MCISVREVSKFLYQARTVMCICVREELKCTALTNILPILFLYLNTVTVTTGTFEPQLEREVWRLKI
jgi:hypothetical protein